MNPGVKVKPFCETIWNLAREIISHSRGTQNDKVNPTEYLCCFSIYKGRTTRPDKARQGRSRPEKAGQGRTKAEQRPDKAGQRPDKAGRVERKNIFHMRIFVNFSL